MTCSQIVFLSALSFGAFSWHRRGLMSLRSKLLGSIPTSEKLFQATEFVIRRQDQAFGFFPSDTAIRDRDTISKLREIFGK